jgi:hypothetical protein
VQLGELLVVDDAGGLLDLPASVEVVDPALSVVPGVAALPPLAALARSSSESAN